MIAYRSNGVGGSRPIPFCGRGNHYRRNNKDNERSLVNKNVVIVQTKRQNNGRFLVEFMNIFDLQGGHLFDFLRPFIN